MTKARFSASVRAVVEFALMGGDLLPGAGLARMREGMLGHQARQAAIPHARAEVPVRGRISGEVVSLTISGRIDALYERDGIPIVEEIKLAPIGDIWDAPLPVHKAQAICYGHLLGVSRAIIRIMYVTRQGMEVAAFEEEMDEAALAAAFHGYTAPYLAMLDGRAAFIALRDQSIGGLAFPFTSYRMGQREMAVHAYTAIKTKRRLFAKAPTGIGKTAAALFPSLKALGEGITGQVFYLTARTTAGHNAATAIHRMRQDGLRLRALTLTAKEKVCAHGPAREAAPAGGFRCDVLTCPLAKGFFDRLPDALSAMREGEDWSLPAVKAVAESHKVCPFEFALSLAEEADLIICDYNYAFDPGVHIRRIFDRGKNLTLLIDEAHNLPDRARAMLSATLETASLRETRRQAGKALGRKSPVYQYLTQLLRLADALPEGATDSIPEGLGDLLTALMEEVLAAIHMAPLTDLSRTLAAALSAIARYDERYRTMVAKAGEQTAITLFCLDPAPHLADVTRGLRGCVFFSATMTPLPAHRDAMGGHAEDGLLSLPSPFPPENFLVLRYALSTRYRHRADTAAAVAAAILAMAGQKPGNYLACFPSYAYLRRIQGEMEALGADVRLHIQQERMSEGERADFLSAFIPRERGVLLGMVVLGGVFGEGIDLPGERLSGVAVVGVGLPQVGMERELLRTYYDTALGDGFAHSYQYPGMNKVLQAVGRVIRKETDRGIALLIDDRFAMEAYARLLPPWWEMGPTLNRPEDVAERVSRFWGMERP